jgi:hypothetical protein
MKGIAKVFGGEDTDTLPRLQRWERNALIPLIEKRLTLVELSGFVDPERSFLRKIVLEEFNRYEVLDEWERFDNAPKRDRETYIESILNRANKFAVSDVRRIFGQMTSTVNFRKAMDEGKIILCNLACGKLSQEEQKMLGIVIVDKITQAGKSRSNIPEERRRPFFFYLDEFQNFVSDDIARALQELRKFKVFFTLAHQELEQLMDDSKKVYSAVLAEPEIKISFRLSREDAEIMAREMFTGKIRGDQIKNMLKQTKFRPILDFRKAGAKQILKAQAMVKLQFQSKSLLYWTKIQSLPPYNQFPCLPEAHQAAVDTLHQEFRFIGMKSSRKRPAYSITQLRKC